MSRFVGKIILSPIETTELWMLEAPIVYESDLLHETVVVPAAFLYDGNSLPCWLWGTLAIFGIYSEPMKFPGAAALHDYGYRYGTWPRKTTDQLYREALKAEGAGWWRRIARYWGVRLFGFHAYQDGSAFED
jgi:hypothetical protein